MKKKLKKFWNWFLGDGWQDALYHGFMILMLTILFCGIFELSFKMVFLHS